jgi:protease-4
VIDAVEHRRDFVNHIKKQYGSDVQLAHRYGKPKRSTVDFNNPFAVFKIWADLLQGGTKTDSGKKDAVAIVYIEGPIVAGAAPQASPFGSQGIAYSDPIRKALEKVADDETIKAVVLRVDSPGGLAVGSGIILQATLQVAAKKPFAVSMGNVAGSGGYYVSCGNETIFADASTITGSIGVVAGKLATQQMWHSLGVNWHPIARGENSGMMYSGEVFTDQQRKTLQNWMDEIYDVFKGHVVKIRGARLTKPRCENRVSSPILPR